VNEIKKDEHNKSRACSGFGSHFRVIFLLVTVQRKRSHRSVAERGIVIAQPNTILRLQVCNHLIVQEK
jgi:hypothetical protein